MLKLAIFCACVAVCLAASPRDYLYYNSPYRHYNILRLDNDIYPDNSYRYAYDTENGISAEETGQQTIAGNSEATLAQGSYRYTSPEGVPVQVQYVANENGYQPASNVLPTSPPNTPSDS
ncbi:hypothetical protein NQ318_011119 [Aromia moschata]|uniref:Uncharacterized protein n=1 Tax=Aromia moschata TaxID=1265417 RepID=A0AAV8YSB5_9CUCU|nr:hypothetical protein NQ318_011119 [Aromia moschata]